MVKKSSLFLIILLISSTAVLSGTSSICGEDTRTQVHAPRIGKIYVSEESENVCTATLIGHNCAITAGHCLHLLSKVRFGSLVFEVDTGSVQSLNQDIGKDWAVLKFKLSPQGFPGKLFGFYHVSGLAPKAGDSIKIAGFGEDLRFGGRRNFSLQEASGKVQALEHDLFGRILVHDVDTMGGNSGSSIIRVSDQAVIGVHTHSGCGSQILGANMGTLISGNPEFQKAIQICTGVR